MATNPAAMAVDAAGRLSAVAAADNTVAIWNRQSVTIATSWMSRRSAGAKSRP